MDSSRSDRIGLVALIVGGVVALAGSVIAYRATTESAQQTAKAAKQLADVALANRDRAELRSVIDQGLDDLAELRSRAAGKQVEWERSFTTETARKDGLEEAQRELTRAFNLTRADGDRIWIRLGHREAHDSYWTAYHEYGEVGACTFWKTPPTKERQWPSDVLIDQAKAWGVQFRDLAFAQVRSTLDPAAVRDAADGARQPRTTSVHPLVKADFLTCKYLKDVPDAAREAVGAGAGSRVACHRNARMSRRFRCKVKTSDGDAAGAALVFRGPDGKARAKAA